MKPLKIESNGTATTSTTSSNSTGINLDDSVIILSLKLAQLIFKINVFSVFSIPREILKHYTISLQCKIYLDSLMISWMTNLLTY